VSAATELGRSAETVAEALRTATAGVQVRVHLYPELGGASLETARGEAYVIPHSGGGFTVEAWHHWAREAHRVTRADNLDTAVADAIEAVQAADPHSRITSPPGMRART
jgi:extradiol dioxygenase family protein